MAHFTLQYILILLLIYTFTLVNAGGGGSIGVNYGRIANNLPSPTKVAALLKSQGFQRVKLYDTDPTVLKSLSNSTIKVTVDLPNELLFAAAKSPAFLSTWVSKNILPFSTLIEAIAVGNEVFVDTHNTTKYLLPAMHNVHKALVKHDLDKNIKVSSPIPSHLCDKLMHETPHKVLALDVYNDKIKHLLDQHDLAKRIEFHRLNIKNDSRLEGLIKISDLVINLAAICTPADYNTRPLDTIYSNFIDALPVVKYCSENGKRLIHFSTCEVYGKTIGSFLPKDSPLRQDPAYYVLKEDASPCIFGSIEKQRWSYACAKQLIERLIYAEGAENGLQFTIVRPFNWIGPRMDFIPGIDGPSEGVPRVLACFSNGLLRREPLKLVDGGESQRTFIYIKDAIEAVTLMIENPDRANGHIFNVGNPNNEVTVRQLAEMMTEVYSKVSGEPPLETPTIDVSSKVFYGEGYDDSDKRIPDMTIINRQLGWNPKTSLWDLLESTLTYQHRTYAEAIKKSMSKPVAQ